MSHVTVLWKVSREPSLEHGDWPQYRADAGRTAYTPSGLPDGLTLRWKLEQPEPRPAWRGVHTRMIFDYAYQPVVSGKTLFFGSSADNKIYAVDTATGRSAGPFFTAGR
jgi:outer membrane protein assembly factor BamB